MKQITVTQLKSLEACSDQVQLFEDTFGPVLEVKSLREAKALARKHTVFDTDWASEYLLSSEGYEAYKKAKAPHWEAYEKAVIPYWEAYEKAVIPYWEAYKKARTPHLEAYKKARTPHLEAYKKARASHLEAYRKAVAPRWEDYDKVRTLVFAEIWWKENT